MSTTTRLLDAAEYRMRRGGYNTVSFRDLASDTDIKSSSVHYHYPKKEDLARALLQRYSERFFDELTKISKDATNPFEKLQAYRTIYRNALTQDGAVCLCALLGSELAGLPDVLTTDIRQFFRSNIKWVEEALPDTLSAEARQVIACSFVSGFQGAMIIANSMEDIDLFDKTTQHLIDSSLEKIPAS